MGFVFSGGYMAVGGAIGGIRGGGGVGDIFF